MAPTATMLTVSTTIAGGTFTAASEAKAIGAPGPIGSLRSNASLLDLKLKEASTLAKQMRAGMDDADPLVPSVQSIIDTLV